MKTLRPANSPKPPSAWEQTVKELQFSTPDVSAHIWPDRNGTTYVTNLAVAHEKRGHGLGTEYMNRLHQAADEHGQPIELGVLRPDLKPWYERLGYREVGENPVMGTMMRRDPRST